MRVLHVVKTCCCFVHKQMALPDFKSSLNMQNAVIIPSHGVLNVRLSSKVQIDCLTSSPLINSHKIASSHCDYSYKDNILDISRAKRP